MQNKSVVAMWGNRKQYMVMNVLYDVGPVKLTFDRVENDGTTVKQSLQAYYKMNFGLVVTDPMQPLLVTQVGGKDIHLPTEFCYMQGIQKYIREDPFKMKEVFDACKLTPTQRRDSISNFSKTLFST